MSVTKRIVPAKKVAVKKAPLTKEAAKRVSGKKTSAKKTPTKKAPTAKMLPLKDGITFPDPGFHIAVLGALLDMKLFSVKVIRAAFLGLDFEEDTSETDRLLAGMERLHALKLDPKQVARIKTLDFDGGNQIYMLLEECVDTDTGGEDDTYALRALTGIAALSSLTNLSLNGHGYRSETLSLKPLADHPVLETLMLTGTCKSATTLETLPRLTELDVQYAKLDGSSVAVRLAKRGVTIVQRT